MKRVTAHRRILAAALCFTLPFGLTACGDDVPDETTRYVGEAASYLTAAEEDGALGADAVADTDATQQGAMADEDVSGLETEPTDDGQACDFSEHRRTVLAKYDDDGDGALNARELRELKADVGERRDTLRPRLTQLGRRARHWAFWRVRWAFDENGDGALSAEERTALVDAMEARCQRLRTERLEQHDTNGDGTLDEAERQAAREARRARWEARRQERLGTYDANDNGVLDAGERVALRQDRVEAAQERRATLLATYDTNGDGRLSTEEALPLRQDIQRRIIEGRDAEG
ncbi:calcium-binding protein [Myxococcus sp. CA039A]|uniref:calcium-binding protein n=1 Tax=Myxococcus sp. CA039A TaxID=2741737 RepID=UPI00157B9009|nr:calcium-binding protein [Myxococcus sp. CA039A]NTX56684.1 calcium-binding protein [Myxococcus sp. CA039A]